MSIVFTNATQNSTVKRAKVHRTQPMIARKVIAFQELVNLNQHKISAREAADLLEIPNSTMQSWRVQTRYQKAPGELSNFLATPAGAEFLQRNIMAVMKLMKCGPGGIRGVKEYLLNSNLDEFVASSEGALQKFWERCEKHIILFGEHEEKRLALLMRHKKVTVGLDEMFKGGRPCLVAIEMVSNYILLEKFTENRTANTWKQELAPRLVDLNVEVDQVVSDLCGAIRAVTKDLGATHIPELFHAQREISQATSFSLISQEIASEKALKEVQERIKEAQEKPRRLEKEERKKQLLQLEEAVNSLDGFKIEFEQKANRREEVKKAIKELSKIHHPIDLKCGALQTAKRVKERFGEQFKIIHKSAKEAKLLGGSVARIKKAQRAFDAIVGYMQYFFTVYAAFVDGMRLSIEEERFFNEVVFPLSYLQMIWRRLPNKDRDDNRQQLQNLEAKMRDAAWPEDVKHALMRRGREIAETFQRSSSCVEGRNGVLSLNHHRFHRLNAGGLRALTIIHNFDIRRSDGTTAAERFFGAKHENLFESLVSNVRIPGRPQQQYHDKIKRQLWREKRQAA